MRKMVVLWGAVGAMALFADQLSAAALVVQDAVQLTDGSTRLVTCDNTKGLFVIYEPINITDAFVVRTDVRNQRLADVLAGILPNGWTIRYVAPGVEDDRVNLAVSTYWADGLKVLAHDFNLFVLINGAKREVLIGRV